MRRRGFSWIVVSCMAFVAMLAMASPALAADTTRASMTWDQPVDIDLYIHDADGNRAWYGDMGGIPDAVLTHDNIDGFPSEDDLSEDFLDQRDGSDRSFAYRACYFDSMLEVTPVTTVTLQVWDPGAASPRVVTGSLSAINDCIDLTRSPDAPLVAPVATVEAGTATVNVDPFSGEVSAWMPSGDRSAMRVQRVVSCEYPGALLENVAFVVETADGSVQHFSVPATAVPGAAAGTYEATIDTSSLPDGSSEIRASFTCDELPEKLQVGEIVLIDPSGNVTDAATGLPIAGATVTLHRMPSAWSPRATSADTGPDRCDSPESRVGDAAWAQVVPAGGFVSDPLDDVQIAPAANPILTNAAGRYAWDVEGGYCWYVTVAKSGYVSATSALVGVNLAGAPVLDLHVRLTPVPAPQPPVTTGGNETTTTQDPAPKSDPTPEVPKQTIVRPRVTMSMVRNGRGNARRPTVTVRGVVTPRACADRARLAVEQKVGRKWTTRKFVRTTRTGGYLASVRLAGRGAVRVTYVGAVRGTTTCSPVSSPSRTLRR